MSELADTIAALEAHQAQIDQIRERNDQQDGRITKLERGMAEVDRAQQTFESLIEIFRTGMHEECERLRRELRSAMNGK